MSVSALALSTAEERFSNLDAVILNRLTQEWNASGIEDID